MKRLINKRKSIYLIFILIYCSFGQVNNVSLAVYCDDVKIFFDTDGTCSEDIKMIAIVIANGGGYPDHITFFQFDNIDGYAYADVDDNFWHYESPSVSTSTRDDFSSPFLGSSEGYIVVVSGDTDEDGNYDNWDLSLTLKDGSYIDSSGEYDFGGPDNNRLFVAVFAFDFAASNAESMLRDVPCYKYESDKTQYYSVSSFYNFKYKCDDFWLYDNDEDKIVNVANNLENFIWPDPSYVITPM